MSTKSSTRIEWRFKPIVKNYRRTQIKGLNARKDEGNAKEPIQADSTTRPEHQTGKEHKQLRRNKVKQHKRNATRTALPEQITTRLS